MDSSLIKGRLQAHDDALRAKLSAGGEWGAGPKAPGRHRWGLAGPWLKVQASVATCAMSEGNSYISYYF